MNKTKCWYCDEEFEYDGEKYRDVPCKYCDIINSIYNPADRLPPEREEEMSPNVNDLNPYLCASDVDDGEVIEFVNAGEFQDKDFSTEQDGSDVRTILNIGVKIANGKNKILTPNKTTRTNISEAFSPDTEKWVGRKAKVEIVKQNVRGTLRKVIYLTPINE